MNAVSLLSTDQTHPQDVVVGVLLFGVISDLPERVRPDAP